MPSPIARRTAATPGPSRPGVARPPAVRPDLVRPRLRVLGGVCAGLAEHLGRPVGVVRVVLLLLCLAGGSGALLYLWLWVTVPSERADARPRLPKEALVTPAAPGGPASVDPISIDPGAIDPRAVDPGAVVPGAVDSGAVDPGAGDPATAGPPAVLPTATPTAALPAPGRPPETRGPFAAIGPMTERARSRPVTELLLGLALLGAGGALVAAQFGAAVPVASLVPGIVVIAGAALAWWQFADLRRSPSEASASGRSRSSTLVRALGALVLVVLGILLFFVTGQNPDVWTVVIAAVSVLVGVGLVVAPWLVRLYRDLLDERSAREREAERAEIAAHLHDSVLQTLALIQQKAGPQSEAARLARAQERELRGWLFTGETAAEVDLAEELRRIAATIETDHAVRVEVVVAGSGEGTAPEPLVAAAREAMLNAARHAGGAVTVYLERGRGAIEIIVSDRGPGLDLAAIPSDRFGVKESIIGRMRRAGGSAVIAAGPGGVGTEVRLRVETVPAPQPEPAAGSRPDPDPAPATVQASTADPVLVGPVVPAAGTAPVTTPATAPAVQPPAPVRGGTS